MNNVFKNKKNYINNINGWINCPKCNFQFEQYNTNKVCRECGYNFRMTCEERLKLISDDGAFEKINEKSKIENHNNQESIIIGKTRICNYEVAIGIMDSFYMAGSIGRYLIDRLCCLIKYAKENKLPLLIFSASGGIKLQEGVNALVGMAKLSSAISDYKEEGLFISFLTNPTYGGLNASLSMLGDIVISENDCKIGFSGKRVIENEYHQKLPDDFQTTEFNFKNGLIDLILVRDEEKEIIGRILEQYYQSRKDKRGNVWKVDKLDKVNHNEKVKNLNIDINKTELIKEIRSEKHIRPYYIVEKLFTSMIEINGDKIKKDDSSIKCCLAKMDDNFFNVIYVNRRNDLEENIANNFGMISPEGYRKANRFIKLSEKLSTPIVLFVDTPGANAGIDAEMNGQAVAIASFLQDISNIKTPIVSFITGEANSGGAIALITGDYLVMTEQSYLSVISPEAYTDIVYKGEKSTEEIVDDLKILPKDMLENKIIDEIIDDKDFEKMLKKMKNIIINKTMEFSSISKEELIKRRKKRIEEWGEYE